MGFKDSESTRSGVGQLTTFNQLGFKGIADKPDGWYLPNNKTFPAIILEVKSTNIELNQKQIDEIIKNCTIAMKKYKNVIGILYNGIDVKVYKNLEEIKVTNELQNYAFIVVGALTILLYNITFLSLIFGVKTLPEKITNIRMISTIKDE